MPVGRVAAVVTEHRLMPLYRDMILAHNAVSEALLETGAVLPAHFGSTSPDVRILRESLGPRAGALTRALIRVRGGVELDVSALVPPGNRLLARELSDLALAAREVLVEGLAPRLHASYLVDRAALPSFRAAFTEVVTRHPAAHITCTGPWPPYSFAPAP